MTMIAGPNWIFIHFPKAGGDFVRKNLTKVLARQGLRGGWWLCPFCWSKSRFPYRHGFTGTIGGGEIFEGKEWEGGRFIGEHMPYSKLPPKHKHKTVLFACRHPFDILVSHFYYDIERFTKLRSKISQEERAAIMSALPDFPNHNFESWARFFESSRLDRELRIKTEMSRDVLGMDIGYFSFRCIWMLFKDPEETLRTMNSDYFISGRYKRDMCDFVKIHTETLAEDLHHVLINLGVKPADAHFLLKEKKKVHPSKTRKNRNWQEFYDDELLAYVLKKEWVWFQIFPEHLEQLKEISGNVKLGM